MHYTSNIQGITVSTIQLPRGDYETCLFDDRQGQRPGNRSSVVAGYGTSAAAVCGHEHYANMTVGELSALITLTSV